MKPSVKVTGLASVRATLRSIGKQVPETARAQMKRSASRIVKRAQLYVPEDEELLKNSIRIEKSYGARGRLQIDIVAGDMTVMNAAGRIIDLGQYAAIIHEVYSRFKPGPKTLAKRAANPDAVIGERFLERAIEEEEIPLRRNIIEAITAIVPKEYQDDL